MQAILNIKPNEIDEHLLGIIKELLSRNVEIVIKKQTVELREFDAALSLEEVMREFSKAGYSQEFLNDLRVGFETSDVYVKHNEDKTRKR
jgi:hypothetical protein